MKRIGQLVCVAVILLSLASTERRPSGPVVTGLLIVLAAIVVLTVRAGLHRTRGSSAPSYEHARLLEQAESRVGRPLALLCPFTLLAQDLPGESWQGRQYLWLGLDEDRLWLLHDAHRHPAHGHDPTSRWLPRIGGVWDSMPRQGIVLRAGELRGCDQLELSWPYAPRLIVGRVYGPREARRRLAGLLAADQLTLRAEAEGCAGG